MQFYLSSYRLGDRLDDLQAALKPGASVAVISNAADFIPAADRIAYAASIFDPIREFRSLGFAARDLDLRTCFDAPDLLREALAGVDLVWVNGGNVFLLRRAMRRAGFDALVRERLAESDLIYGGWSAGAVVAGPSLRGLELMDDPDQTAAGYEAETLWDGLGLVDFSVVPHFQSDHPEAAAAEQVVARLISEGRPFRALSDGDVIIL